MDLSLSTLVNSVTSIRLALLLPITEPHFQECGKIIIQFIMIQMLK